MAKVRSECGCHGVVASGREFQLFGDGVDVVNELSMLDGHALWSAG